MTLTYRNILTNLHNVKTFPYRRDPEANEAILDEVVSAIECILLKLADKEDATIVDQD